MRRGLTTVGLLGCIALLFVTPVFATDSTTPVAAAPTVTAAVASAQAPAVPTNQGSTVTVPVNSPINDDGVVTLDFQEADIRNVLKVLAFKTGMNIVAGPEVSGNVTIQLKDVPWQKALEVILSTYGFGYEQRGNIIRVMSVENLKKYHEDSVALQGQEPLVTKTFSMNFAKASDVMESISKMKTERGSVNFDQRTNTIIVRDVQGNINLMDEVIKNLDTVTPQVLIEAKVVKTQLSNTENLGVDWSLSLSATAGKRPSSFPFDPDATNKFLQGVFPSPTSAAFAYGTLDASGLSATLNMLKSRSDTETLSNPKIMTVDNQPAKIVVGEKYPFPQYTYNTEQAKMQVSGWEYKDIGIIFEVVPHVNNRNLVTLDLHPSVSDAGANVTVEGTSVPRINVEETQTKVMVENGQTLVIAGLIKSKTSKIKKKVPLLSEIPLVGRAFRNDNDTQDKTELLIFITPHIIYPGSTQEKSTTTP